MSHVLAFQRFEYKYWIPNDLVEPFIGAIDPFVQCDDRVAGGAYNTSLYLDSMTQTFAHLHSERVPDRIKLRVRAYGRPPTEPAFFEIKRKAKAVTYKQRAVVPFAHMASILAGTIPPDLQLGSPKELQTLRDFVYLMIVYQAAPSFLICAKRRAFSSRESLEDVRITLDSDVSYQPMTKPSLVGEPNAWTNVSGYGTYRAEAATLLEIKFRGVAPAWLVELIQRVSLTRSRFSKYITAVLHQSQQGAAFDAFARTPGRLIANKRGL